MFKKQQKWIALFVVLTFIWLMQVSTMPMAAAGTSEKISSAGSDQGPNFIEGEGPRAPNGKGKSILPWILIGVGVITITALAVILLTINRYDITGTWNFYFISTEFGDDFDWSMTFSGNKKSGTFIDSDAATGTYAVDGKNITRIQYDGVDLILSGQFNSKDTLSGTYTWNDYYGDYGTWSGTRVGSAAATPRLSSRSKEKKNRGMISK